MGVPPTGITLTLTLLASGDLDISGPTANRMLCLGMLELAKDTINQHHNAQMSRIIRPETQAVTSPGAPR